MARKVVWSSAGDDSHRPKICTGCGQVHEGPCAANSATSPARLRLEKRRGKTITIIAEVPLTGASLKECLKELKKRCATGGTVKGGCIELQGDHVASVREYLDSRSIPHKGWH